jgi:glycosyltransferase involved in cell wall biosynthesis|tara:strand:- start:763 stop:1896 length:1134 start_codon:yes stop_codon:yes gene_type:complete
MRIIVDARKVSGKHYGIGTYIRRLGETCARLSPSDDFVFLGETDRADGKGVPKDAARISGDNVTWEPNSSANYGLRELVSVSWQVRNLAGDVFHAPHYVYPLMLPCPGVVTIHDCIHLRFPQQFPKLGSNSYARMMIRRAVARSDRVLTVSEATRADLVDLVDADPSKIEVIRHGCDPYFLEAVDDLELSDVAEKHSLDRPFLLSVTNIKPHKNLKRLLESFEQLRRDYDDLDLVIAGGDFSQHPKLQAACKSYGIEDRVKPLGFLPKKEIRALYSLARIFVFPSLYEGSGLPPLEAMACGTPVVASDNSAIPEIVGRNGLLVNPYRVDAITEAIRSLLEDSSLRDALGAQGKLRAKEFDWDKSARRVLDVYREVAT